MRKLLWRPFILEVTCVAKTICLGDQNQKNLVRLFLGLFQSVFSCSRNESSPREITNHLPHPRKASNLTLVFSRGWCMNCHNLREQQNLRHPQDFITRSLPGVPTRYLFIAATGSEILGWCKGKGVCNHTLYNKYKIRTYAHNYCRTPDPRKEEDKEAPRISIAMFNMVLVGVVRWFHVYLNSVQQMLSGELARECLQTGFERHGLPPQRAPLDTVHPLREHLNSVQRIVSGGSCEGCFQTRSAVKKH